MILIQVPVGFLLPATFGPSFREPEARTLHMILDLIHYTNGFLILLLATYRLTWRFRNPVPELPTSLAIYQRWLARLTHAFLYVLLFLLPFSGWAALSVLGETQQFGEIPIYFLWFDIVPPILPQLPLDHTFGYGFFATIHRYAAYTGGTILSLHIAAALWHHLWRKDHILLRMWPAAPPGGTIDGVPGE